MPFKSPWQGRSWYQEGPEIDQTLHRLGNPANFIEFVQEQMIPTVRLGEVGKRWRVTIDDEDTNRLHVQPDQHRRWPTNGHLFFQRLVRDCIVHGGSAFEYNSLESKSQWTPAVMPLPFWSLAEDGDDDVQVQPNGSKTPIDRLVVVTLDPRHLNPLQEAVRALVEVAMDEREAMRLMPAAIMGQTRIDVRREHESAQVRELKATRRFGYPGYASNLRVSPEYSLERQLRAAEIGYTLRRSLLDQINNAFGAISGEYFPGEVSFHFDEAFDPEEVRRAWNAQSMSRDQVAAKLRFE